MQFAAALCVFAVTALGLAVAFPLAYEADRYPAEVEYREDNDNVPSSEIEEYFRAQSVPSSDSEPAYQSLPRAYEDPRIGDAGDDGPGMQAFPNARMNYYPAIQEKEDEDEEGMMPGGMQNARMSDPYMHMQLEEDEEEEGKYNPYAQGDDEEEEEEQMPNAQMNYYPDNGGPGMQAFPNARMNYYPYAQEDDEDQMMEGDDGPGTQAFPNARMNYYPYAQEDDGKDDRDQMMEGDDGPGMQAFPDAKMNNYPNIQGDDEDQMMAGDNEFDGPGMQTYPDAKMNYYYNRRIPFGETMADNGGPGMQAFPDAQMNYYPNVQEDDEEEEDGNAVMQAFEKAQGGRMEGGPALMQEFNGYMDSMPEEQAIKAGMGEEEAMEEYISEMLNIAANRRGPVGKAEVEEYFQQ